MYVITVALVALLPLKAWVDVKHARWDDTRPLKEALAMLPVLLVRLPPHLLLEAALVQSVLLVDFPHSKATCATSAVLVPQH